MSPAKPPLGRHPTPGHREIDRIRRTMVDRDRRRSGRAVFATASEILARERRSAIARSVRQAFPTGWPRILDVGCGSGADLAAWVDRGWPTDGLAGVDLVPERVAVARSRTPGVDVRMVDGFSLPFGSGSFDVATASTVFSSILDPRHRRELFCDMARVVAPGGLILIYDFRIRKPTNRDVVAMTGARLRDMAPPADRIIALGPFIYAIGLAESIDSRLTALVMRHAPRTHFLACWRSPEPTRAAAG